MIKSFKSYLNENISAGSGAIAGIGVNPDGTEYNAADAETSFGEPGMTPSNIKKYKKRNTEDKKKRDIKWSRKILQTIQT